ncbi:uncharacterized protein G2W53_005615 [Senna tora]|uniref:RNase H type-1 domain-containing protein n=1 Tax=Senna tora TaxID=362788 RepID=A0A834X3X3_9FABA|nr:uncharacterized protein G2W53_005615 [Senna tora]
MASGRSSNKNTAKQIKPKGRWMWRFNANGLFSVKSAYKVVHNSYSRTNTWTRYSSVWKKIWKAKLPPKIRSFCWRAYRGILPTCVNLKNRGMEVDTRCCVCGLEDENTSHALVGCPELKSLWDNHMSDADGQFNTNEVFVEWFSNKGTRRDDRNRAIMEGQWEAPMWHEMKVNVDASFLGQGKGGIGCVVRNFQGSCLAAFAKRIQNIESPDLLEAYAFLKGLELAKNLRCDNIILEGEAKKVVDLIHGSSQNLSHMGMIVDDIRKGMKNFSRVKIQWVSRNSNAVADRIANFACNLDNSQVWLKDFPPFISDVLINDCNHSYLIE